MIALKNLVYLAVLIQAFFSLNNQLPTWFWFQEVSINLGAYWLLAHAATLLLLLLVRRHLNQRLACLSIVSLVLFSLTYLFQLRTFLFYGPPLSAQSGDHRLKVLLVSVQKGRGGEVSRLLDATSPDVLGLLGVDSAAAAELRLAERFPYSKSELRGDGFGIGLYSRYPVSADTRTSVGELLPPIVSTTLSLDDTRTIQILLLHAPSPFAYASYHDNKLLVRRTSTPLRQSSGPLLVFGNFNATEFSGSYKRFRSAGELLNAKAGYGYLRTWDAGSDFLRLSLDHILYRDIEVAGFQRFPNAGSDHYPILAEFAW